MSRKMGEMRCSVDLEMPAEEIEETAVEMEEMGASEVGLVDSTWTPEKPKHG